MIYMITPLEIQNKEFRRGIRGYKEDEVDEFLDKIILDYEKLYKENLELKDNLEGMHHQLEQYREIEETLKKTLIMAQNAAKIVKPIPIPRPLINPATKFKKIIRLGLDAISMYSATRILSIFLDNSSILSILAIFSDIPPLCWLSLSSDIITTPILFYPSN
jgi:DivIVA domain-containing protein